MIVAVAACHGVALPKPGLPRRSLGEAGLPLACSLPRCYHVRLDVPVSGCRGWGWGGRWITAGRAEISLGCPEPCPQSQRQGRKQ